MFSWCILKRNGAECDLTDLFILHRTPTQFSYSFWTNHEKARTELNWSFPEPMKLNCVLVKPYVYETLCKASTINYAPNNVSTGSSFALNVALKSVLCWNLNLFTNWVAPTWKLILFINIWCSMVEKYILPKEWDVINLVWRSLSFEYLFSNQSLCLFQVHTQYYNMLCFSYIHVYVL